jgi:hypothetical protein
MVYITQKYWVFRLSIVRYSNKYSISETGCFLPQMTEWETPILSGSLERANLQVQWLRLVLSNGPKRVGVTHPITWGWKLMQFPKRCVLQNIGRWVKSTNSVKKVKFVNVLNWLSTKLWRHMTQWRYSSTIRDLNTRWRWLVSFTPWPLYPRGKSSRYRLDRRLGGPQSRSECCGEEKNLVPARIRTAAVQFVARRYSDWAIPVPSTNSTIPNMFPVVRHGLLHWWKSTKLQVLKTEISRNI